MYQKLQDKINGYQCNYQELSGLYVIALMIVAGGGAFSSPPGNRSGALTLCPAPAKTP
jgi:hypothetical protein